MLASVIGGPEDGNAVCLFLVCFVSVQKKKEEEKSDKTWDPQQFLVIGGLTPVPVNLFLEQR